MKKLYLVDVSSMFFRAFYAIPPLNSQSGMPTNALYGFLNMTIKLLRDVKPDYMAFCFDRKEPSFRLDLYPEYKANRGEMPEELVPQVPYVRKLTEKIGIPHFDRKGFEADDVIGSFTKFGTDNKLEVVIVSGDKDFAQLINPNVSMYDTMKNKTYDEQGVIEKWGVRADQMIDYLALVGDSSDNIPGVRGIGPKGAQKLLAQFDTLDGIYKGLDEVSGKSMLAKLKEHKDMAYLSQELVTIDTGIDFGVKVEDLKLKEINNAELNELLTELDFNSFERALTGGASGAPESQFKPSHSKKASSSKEKPKKKIKVDVAYGLEDIKPKTMKVEAIAKKIKPYAEVYLLVSERGTYLGHEDAVISIDGELSDLGKALEQKMVNWKGFDLKDCWKELSIKADQVANWDHMLAAYTVRAGAIDSFDKIYELYTGELVPDLYSPEQYYHCHLRLESALKQKLEAVNGSAILSDLELPLVPVLYNMEVEGIQIDEDNLAKQSKDLDKDIKKLEKEIHKIAGEAFNIASPKQLGVVLFDKLGLPPSKKTKTGFSTSSDVLLKLRSEHEIAQKVIDYRELAKLRSTYVDALPQLVDEKTKKLHTHLRQAVTSTGRLSSTNPNLQNIPIRTERGRLVRQAFVADEGKQLLSVDYSQIELRVLAHITDDPGLCSAFNDGLDIHAATAAEIFDVSLDDVTADLRRKAKAVNFGIAYGQGVYGLSEALGIPRGEASEIIGNYFGRFKNVKDYMEQIVERAKADGYVETLLGRRRYIDELSSKNGQLRKFGERAAINAPIQGTASDIVKKAMIDVYNEISCQMLLQVHDELLFECDEDDLEEQAEVIKECMESVVKLKVPLLVNVAWGSNWEDAHA